MASLAMVVIIFALGRIAIINSERRDAEKTRGDLLQDSVNALRARTDQNRDFFEIVRQLLIAQGQDQKDALLNQLRGFKFTEPTTTTTTTIKPGAKATPTTTTPPKPLTTTAPPPPPSTTTTTKPPPPSPPPPPPRTCVTTAVLNVCPPNAASTNERKFR